MFVQVTVALSVTLQPTSGVSVVRSPAKNIQNLVLTCARTSRELTECDPQKHVVVENAMSIAFSMDGGIVFCGLCACWAG